MYVLLDIRLMDGPDASSGRVEIFFEGKWGTICDDGFDDLDADVICRQFVMLGTWSGGIVYREMFCMVYVYRYYE